MREGVRPVSLYSIEEVFSLLNSPHPRLDLHDLEKWIRIIIKDEELADLIKTVTEHEGSDRDKLLIIRDLLGCRLLQCRQLSEAYV